MATGPKLFHPGHRVKPTAGASSLGIDFRPYLERHLSGDWGSVLPEEAEANYRAAASGDRGSYIVSIYPTPRGKVWLVTCTGDYTVIMLPSEIEQNPGRSH